MTDRDQSAFEDALRADLTASRQEVMLIKDQLREANTLNEALSYKVDFLTSEVARITASREQYERVSIRVATFAESCANVAIKQLQDLQEEIKAAAFAKVPGAVQTASAPRQEAGIDNAITAMEIEAEQIGKTFDAGFKTVAEHLGNGSSASLLPRATFGNGAKQR